MVLAFFCSVPDLIVSHFNYILSDYYALTALAAAIIAQIEQLPIDRQDAIAARFLAELEEEQQAENVWVEDIRTKIDAAISASEQTPPIDGETFVNQILERLQRGRV